MSTRPWMRHVLWVAAVYNLTWGALVVFAPGLLFHWAGMPAPNHPEIWQCLGMVVGVYGVGYAIAARDPLRHWPIVLVGLMGKVLGPIGFVNAARHGDLPWRAGWLNLTNDLIWWIPFTMILWAARRASEAAPLRPSAQAQGSPERLAMGEAE